MCKVQRLNARRPLSLTIALCVLLGFSLRTVYAQEPDALSKAFQRVAETITPSVVNIRSTGHAKIDVQDAESVPPGLRDYLEKFAPPQSGLGSGVIIDKEGHILTNNHVVAGAEEISVRLTDKRTFPAKLIGTDLGTDVAVIKIDADGLVPAKLGDSDALSIGEFVVAAGTPFGLDNTITAGIVSAKGRSSILGGNSYEDFIQTDAAINPGNSGGPLANLQGQVVGINTAIFSRTGGYMGIGFAIPINLCRSVFESLITDGRVIRGWLGVGIQNITEDLAKSFGFSSTEGALVGHIAPGGPADQAKVRQGDIITHLNGERIENINHLRNAIAATKPGTAVDLKIFRHGDTRDVRITLGELPAELTKAITPSPEEEKAGEDIGMQLENLSPETARQLGVSPETGVLIRGIRPGSLAAASEFQPGDIIRTIDGKQVRNISDFRKLMTKAALKKGLLVVVENQHLQRFVSIQQD